MIKADLGLHSQIVDIAKDLTAGGMKVLDFGAGEGALSMRLHDMGYDVTAVDIDAANFKAKNIKFVPLNFNNKTETENFMLRYRNYFDLVLGVEVIEHVESPSEYVRILKQLAKPGGYLIITTPNISSWFSRMKFLITGRFHSFSDDDVEKSGHITPVHEFQLRHIFEHEKIKLISLKPGGTLPVLWITRSLKFVLLNLLFIPLRLFMQGMQKGYCVIAVGQKE